MDIKTKFIELLRSMRKENVNYVIEDWKNLSYFDIVVNSRFVKKMNESLFI